MNENQTKLDLLRKEIEKSSQKETETIVSDAEKSSAQMLESLTKELSGQHDNRIRKITDDFRNSEKKRVSEVCFSEGKKVLTHRNKRVNEFFGRIEKKLCELTETPRYKSYLSECIKKSDEYSPLTEGVTVLCRTCDTAVVDSLLSGFSCSLSQCDDIKIGGILVKYEEKNILTDLTIDAALENEREKFAALKEMQL